MYARILKKEEKNIILKILLCFKTKGHNILILSLILCRTQ